MENFSLGQDINECLVHGELVLRTEQTSSPCTILIYVLSSGQVLHAQGTHLCSVLSASSPYTRHSSGQDITECLVHGELVLRTGYK
jgi:hypothetical protein